MLRFSEWLLENKSGNVNNPDGINQYTFSPEEEKKMSSEQRKELKDIEDSIDSDDFTEEEKEQLQKDRTEFIKKMRQKWKVEDNKYLSDDDKKEFDEKIKNGSLKDEDFDEWIEKKENELKDKDFEKWYGVREEERNEFWEKKIKGDPSNETQFKQQKDVVDKVFNKKYFKENEEMLSKYFDNLEKDKQDQLKKELDVENVEDFIKHIEQGGLKPRGGFKKDLQKKYKDCEHFHISKTGFSKSDRVVIYFKEGKIRDIGTHKQLDIEVEGR